MAVLFRQSLLLNSILCNSEVLYGLNQEHINTLESVDKYFWRKVFGSPISTPTESFYIETNSVAIRHIIMGRRLMYYWNILQKNDSELVKKVYNIQKKVPVKSDWALQIQNDLVACDITLSEEEIKSMKKERFKNLVKQKIRNLSKQYLISLRSKHSKSEKLLHENVIKEYLTCQEISTEEKKLLFALKTKTVNVKTNYSSGYKDNMQCRLCGKPGEDESEIHILTCQHIVNENGLRGQLDNLVYSDIFGSLKKQIEAVKIWKKVLKVWNIKLEALKSSPRGHQVHLPPGLSASYACTSTQTVDPPSFNDSNSLDDSNCIVYDFG